MTYGRSSARNHFVLLKWDGLIPQRIERSKQKHIYLFCTILNLYFKVLVRKGYYGVDP